MRSNQVSWIVILVCMILIGSSLIPGVLATGMVVTEGDTLLKTKDVRAISPNNGKGIIVGVITDGADNYSQAVQSGDLPENVVILSSSCKSTTDLGTAEMEIIHDIAPGATLLFHDYGCDGDDALMSAYDALVDAGADIILTDVEFNNWPIFEDNAVTLHLKKLMKENPNLILVAAAGHRADLQYQAEFSRQSDGTHNFDGKTGIPVDIQTKGVIEVDLHWDDPYRSPENKYELRLVDRISRDTMHTGKRDSDQKGLPLQTLRYMGMGKETNQYEIQVWAEGDVESRKIELFINYSNRTSVDKSNLIFDDSYYGIQATPGVIAVIPCKPTESEIQSITSWGTTTFTDISLNSRDKPDITAPSSVSVTGAGGFKTPFEGSSASASHIAGLIALLWSNFPDMSAAEIKNALFLTATDQGDPGWDRVYGYGLANADAMYTHLLSTQIEPKESTEVMEPVITIQQPLIPEEELSPEEDAWDEYYQYNRVNPTGAQK